jgi:Domain of unknown function (DUF4157)
VSQQRIPSTAAREGNGPVRPARHEAQDTHEREADRNAQAIARRGASCTITPMATARRRAAGQRPESSALPTSAGEGLDPLTRRFMQRRLGHDFSDVRIHADETAARAAQERNAHAYVSGRHVVFGRGEYAPKTGRGRMLLAHELTHVAQQSSLARDAEPVVQHLGIGQFFARLFGEGTFSDDELEVYLARLENEPGIEDHFDSDNKARAIVNKGKHKDLPLAIRVKLIQEMLSGVTGDDDENAILKILEDASPLDREVLIERVGYDRLDDKINGAEHDRLLKIAAGVHRAGKQPVPTTWTMSYAVKGASELRTSTPAIEVLDLDATPDGEAAGRRVVTEQTIQSPSGSPQFLAGGFDHPRNKKGEGSLAFRVLPTDKEKKPIPEDGSSPEQLTAPYSTITYDKRLIDAHVDVTYDRLESPITTEESSQHAKEKGHETEQARSQTESATKTSGHKTTTGTTSTTGTETGRSQTESEKKGQATTKSQSETKGSTEGESKTHQESKSQTDTSGKSSTKTEGTSATHKEGESDTTKEEKTHTEMSHSHKQINIHLEGTIEGNLSDLLKQFAGKVITGGILDKFLDRAGRPGSFLKKLIKKYNPIDMLLEGVGDSFTLKGTLKGDMAFEWESQTSDSTTTGTSHTKSSEDATTKSSGTSDTTSSQESKTKGSQDTTTTSKGSSSSQTQGSADTQSRESEKGTTKSTKSREDRTKTTGEESSTGRSDTKSETKSSGQRDTTKATDTSGRKVIERRWIPVIKDRSLSFTVK